jgi:diadenosine tetraphosphate (Ap4A) HIT family hydrolase
MVVTRKRIFVIAITMISKRHVMTFFDLFEPERRAIHQLLDALRIDVMKKDVAVSGFNIGMNNGDTAGQTIGHAHVHLNRVRPFIEPPSPI